MAPLGCNPPLRCSPRMEGVAPQSSAVRRLTRVELSLKRVDLVPLWCSPELGVVPPPSSVRYRHAFPRGPPPPLRLWPLRLASHVACS